ALHFRWLAGRLLDARPHTICLLYCSEPYEEISAPFLLDGTVLLRSVCGLDWLRGDSRRCAREEGLWPKAVLPDWIRCRRGSVLPRQGATPADSPDTRMGRIRTSGLFSWATDYAEGP